jgi:hypothetical protein
MVLCCLQTAGVEAVYLQLVKCSLRLVAEAPPSDQGRDRAMLLLLLRVCYAGHCTRGGPLSCVGTRAFK